MLGVRCPLGSFLLLLRVALAARHIPVGTGRVFVTPAACLHDGVFRQPPLKVEIAQI